MIKRILRWLLLAIVLLILVGIIYEQIGERHDHELLPQVGTSIDVGGHSLNIFCSGKGTPPVILDGGAGAPGYSWSGIQPELAKTTETCWFDRAGEGWSDPGPFPRTSAAIADEEHVLLKNAGIAPPYVLVGHSFGGLNARVYAGHYPSEVAGMVLVDAAHEDEPARAPKFMLGHTLPRPLWIVNHWAAQGAARVGLIRFLVGSPTLPAKPTREQKVAALKDQPKALATLADYVTGPESYQEAHEAPGIGDKPLIVLTAGRPWGKSGDAEIDRQASAYQQVWIHEIQPKLTHLSTRGRQIIVTTSGHGIPEEAPGAVIDAVRNVVGAVRVSR
jgi:pimeloyl-ACP methyl ester carboxylesterase